VPELDAEALALVLRAQPLPAIPSDMPQDRLELIIPIEFTLHR
jgi:protein TonB